jgi:hypothetical protein
MAHEDQGGGIAWGGNGHAVVMAGVGRLAKLAGCVGRPMGCVG